MKHYWGNFSLWSVGGGVGVESDKEVAEIPKLDSKQYSLESD